MFRQSQPDELSVTELEMSNGSRPIRFHRLATLEGVPTDIGLSIILETGTMAIQVCCSTALV